MVTFLLSGLWHGANFTFIVWGALHGLYQIVGDVFNRLTGWKPKGNTFVNGVKIIFTFALVCFAWIFFRANTTGDAFFIARHLFSDIGQWGMTYLYDALNNLGLQLIEVLLGFMAIALLLGLECFSGKESVPDKLAKIPSLPRWGLYLILAMAIASAGVFGNAAEFIYFQF
jgi:hypothetical protein